MLFDGQIQVAQLEIEVGADHIQVAQVLALALPAGPGQVVPIPAGIFRFGLTKQDALTYGQELLDKANTLPDEKASSDLIVAQSLAGVDEAVKQADKLKQGQ